jgi:hypothetical protein
LRGRPDILRLTKITNTLKHLIFVSACRGKSHPTPIP